MDNRRDWMSIVLEEGLKLGVLDPDDILRHATPAVLATDLPPAVVASLLQGGIDSGSFNSEFLVYQLGARTLGEHIPLPVLWGCVREAAERIIAEHPMTRGTVSADEVGAVVDLASAMLEDDTPDIEVIEE